MNNVLSRTVKWKLAGCRSGAKRRNRKVGGMGHYLFIHVTPGRNPSHATHIPYITFQVSSISSRLYRIILTG